MNLTVARYGVSKAFCQDLLVNSQLLTDCNFALFFIEELKLVTNKTREKFSSPFQYVNILLQTLLIDTT